MEETTQRGVEIDYPRETRFSCLRCACCCRDTEERVRRIRLTQYDADLIEKKADLPLETFAEAVDPPLGPFKYLMKKIGGRCVFLEADVCRIYDKRPTICRYFPFYLIRTRDRFTFKISPGCPGIGEGKILKKAFFQKLLELAFKAYGC